MRTQKEIDRFLRWWGCRGSGDVVLLEGDSEKLLQALPFGEQSHQIDLNSRQSFPEADSSAESEGHTLRFERLIQESRRAELNLI